MQNPAAYSYFANDPKIKKAYEVMSAGEMPNNFNFEDFMKNMEKEEPNFAEKPEKMDEEKPTPQK